MQREERLVEQPVQVEHVGAPSREQVVHDTQGCEAAQDLTLLEVHEDGGALGGILRLLRQFGHQPCHALPNAHCANGTTSVTIDVLPPVIPSEAE